ncbi:MAG: DUF4282 domain-containing protein [Proteobacteria bacterium]|nr:DUF4282 domain-containing protein [Pseudomonadota bacterium]
MKDILVFETMVTPKLITFIYWILLVLIVMGGIGYIFSNFSIMRVIVGVGMIAGGGVCARIYCELLIVIFKINENIKKIADK